MTTYLKLCAIIAFASLYMQQACSQVRLPRLIRDSMILQRDTELQIWGWARPKEKVKLWFQQKKYTAVTGADGKWQIKLPPTKAGGPHTMKIVASNSITINNILTGDVWLCSGQSNMVHQMALHSISYAQDIEQANYPEIRQFWIPTITDLTGPKDDLPTGFWKWANPQDVKQFSVAAYFFARSLYEQYHIPIGIINSSVGGPPIEAWISEEGLKDFDGLTSTLQKNKDTAYVNSTNRKAIAANSMPEPDDKAVKEAVHWYDTSYIPKGWRNINIPGYWEDQGIKNLDGIVWYRKEVSIPASMTGTAATVFLGRIVDADMLYINGIKVATTSYQYPQRRYAVPRGILKPGKNIVIIKVTNYSGKGGFVPDKPYYLVAGTDTLDLKGTWQYKVGAVFIPKQGPIQKGIAAQDEPTSLYNAMIAPLIHYRIKGMLWYQGEGNIARPAEYEKLLPALIADWRNKWKQPNAPFLYVQLPNYGDMNYLPSESNWARLRESQLKTLSVANTAMAVTIDLGEWNDIHPDNKKDIGLRLAVAAKKIVYNEAIVHSGPLYQSSAIEGNKVVITFTHTGSGLITNDGEPPGEFAIAGADKKFKWAKAKINGNTIIVWNENVPEPLYVRYAWADNPVHPNVYNKEGLPASPFRTDD
ncbi:MAG TPA: sialate O-acetylesterase [Ferruginibacter sp.]|nr:sialate O-acetylesterase [Ferruginibacter sp.]HMP21105.1 sialate O-acetylesterase [Ferruginibacter sp.]